jgi:hypothetical protein
MTQKHTPGPWIVKDGQVVDLQDRMICPVIHGHNIRSEAFGRDSNQLSSVDDGGESNASLIAAAPDLLAQLKIMVEWAEPYNDATEKNLDDANDAIAKAEGK